MNTSTILRDLVIPGLDKLGATVPPNAYNPDFQRRLETVVGTLSVILCEEDGDWIACRFEDVEKAKQHFGIFNICQGRLNPYSGKWNWHCWEFMTRDEVEKMHRTSKVSDAHLKALAEAFLAAVQPLIPVKSPVDSDR